VEYFLGGRTFLRDHKEASFWENLLRQWPMFMVPWRWGSSMAIVGACFQVRRHDRMSQNMAMCPNYGPKIG